MKLTNLFTGTALALTVLFTIAACAKQNIQPEGIQAASAQTKTMSFYALDNQNNLVAYAGIQTFRETGSVAITGTMANERILAIDFRPATGQLYGVSNQSRLYVINPASGAATAVNSTPFTPAINGTEVAFDFNPTVDRIRLITNTKQNLRLNPVTGAVAAVDGNINPGENSVVAAAYTNSFAGATSTTLYDIDINSDKLYIQMPPNNGTLVAVGPLGIDAKGEGGFDISANNQLALAVLYAMGDDEMGDEDGNGFHTRFYYIDLKTGKAKNAGKANRMVTGIAIKN